MKFPFVIAVFIFTLAGHQVSAQSAKTAQEIPKEKQTSLGLYVTSKEAFEKWKADPKQVKILDVRTPEEYVFVGHPEMAWNIPFLFMTHQWDEEKNWYALKPNREFVAQVKDLFKPKDTILVMCRSGDRAALAVDELAKAGFTNVYNIVHGMEGDLVDDPDNLYHGKRMKNGWKNSGAPWTCKVDRERAWVPKDEKTEADRQP